MSRQTFRWASAIASQGGAIHIHMQTLCLRSEMLGLVTHAIIKLASCRAYKPPTLAAQLVFCWTDLHRGAEIDFSWVPLCLASSW